MTTTMSEREVDNAIVWFTRDGVVGKLRRSAPHFDNWRTRLSASAYAKGFEAGIMGALNELANPYPPKHAAPNYQRGANSPFDAWEEGRRDGYRVRQILTEPEKVRDIRASEYRLLPTGLRLRIDEQYAKENRPALAR